MPEKITLEQAIKEGRKVYFTGEPCAHDHISPRSIHNRNCTECAAIQRHARYRIRKDTDAAFVESNRTRAREWTRANPERNLMRYTEWCAKNPERAKEILTDWIIKNPEKYAESRRARDANRKTRKKENGGRCTIRDLRAMKAAQKGRCASCLKKTKTMEIDHIRPLSKGGSSDPSNLQLLCKPCNRHKAAKDPIAWARQNGRLV